MSKNRTYLEATFRNIVSICSDATGSNAAFDPKFGTETLNKIRVELDLPKVDEAEMAELLDD